VCSTHNNEVWPLLLEKACAKAMGSYASLLDPCDDIAARDAYIKRLMTMVELRDRSGIPVGHHLMCRAPGGWIHQEGGHAMEEAVLRHAFRTMWDSGIPALSNPTAMLPLVESATTDSLQATKLMPHAVRGGAAIAVDMDEVKIAQFGAMAAGRTVWCKVIKMQRARDRACNIVVSIMSPNVSIPPTAQVCVRLTQEQQQVIEGKRTSVKIVLGEVVIASVWYDRDGL